MRIRLYGRLADTIGPEIELSGADGCSVADVRRQLAAIYGQLAPALGRSRAVMSDRLVHDEQLVGETDALEFLPPVSGG